MPNARRVATGPAEGRKKSKTITPGTKLRTSLPGNVRMEMNSFELAAVRLYKAWRVFPEMVSRLTDFFQWRFDEETKHGWVHEAQKTPSGAPVVSFRDAMILWMKEQYPAQFESYWLDVLDFKISSERLCMLQAVDRARKEGSNVVIRENVLRVVQLLSDQYEKKGVVNWAEEEEEVLPPVIEVPSSTPPPVPVATAEDDELKVPSSLRVDLTESDAEGDDFDPDSNYLDYYGEMDVDRAQSTGVWELLMFAYRSYFERHDNKVCRRVFRYALPAQKVRMRILRPKFGRQDDLCVVPDPAVPLPGALGSVGDFLFEASLQSGVTWFDWMQRVPASSRALLMQCSEEIMSKGELSFYAMSSGQMDSLPTDERLRDQWLKWATTSLVVPVEKEEEEDDDYIDITSLKI